MENKIKSIIIDQIGLISNLDGEIKETMFNGEMAQITWYRQNNKVWNGKYVIQVEYEDKL